MDTMISATSRKLDLSRYARPELVKAIGRVADFFGDSIQSVAIPPVVLVGIALVLSYFLPFSSYLASVLFLIVGVAGGILTGLSYGALRFTTLATRDLKLIITETLYLAHNMINDVASYAKEPSAFPALSEIVHAAITTLIQPIMEGIFKEKFYGGLLNYITKPIMQAVDKWLTSLVGSMERRFASSPKKLSSSSSSSSSIEDQHDIKSKHESMATERHSGSTEVAHKRDKLFDALESARKRIIPKIEDYSRKVHRPLRFTTFLSGGTTIVLCALIYNL